MYICGRYARYVCWTGPDGRHEHGREGEEERHSEGKRRTEGGTVAAARQARRAGGLVKEWGPCTRQGGGGECEMRG